MRDKVHADVAVVESPDAARAAIGTRIPDVLLLSALLSPRDEDELIAHLRGLDGAGHIQTHTIPQLASTAADQEPGGRRSLLGVFKRKKEAPQPIVTGCDPDLFADEISTFLQRAAEKKAEGVAALQSRVDQLEYQVQSTQTAGRAARDSSCARARHDPAVGRFGASLFVVVTVRMAEESRGPSLESRVPSRKSRVPQSQVPSPNVASPESTSRVPSRSSRVPRHTFRVPSRSLPRMRNQSD